MPEGESAKRASKRAEKAYLGGVMLDLESSRDAIERGVVYEQQFGEALLNKAQQTLDNIQNENEVDNSE